MLSWAVGNDGTCDHSCFWETHQEWSLSLTDSSAESTCSIIRKASTGRPTGANSVKHTAKTRLTDSQRLLLTLHWPIVGLVCLSFNRKKLINMRNRFWSQSTMKAYSHREHNEQVKKCRWKGKNKSTLDSEKEEQAKSTPVLACNAA